MKKLLMFSAIALLSFASCKKEENPQLKLDADRLTLKVGERHQFVISKGETIYKAESFDWYSSDLSIGNVNGSGQFHSGKEGVVTIRAEYQTTVLKCIITVKN